VIRPAVIAANRTVLPSSEVRISGDRVQIDRGFQETCLVEQEVDGDWTGGVVQADFESGRHSRWVYVSAFVSAARARTFPGDKFMAGAGFTTGRACA
jgi:hypothetical protein